MIYYVAEQCVAELCCHPPSTNSTVCNYALRISREPDASGQRVMRYFFSHAHELACGQKPMTSHDQDRDVTWHKTLIRSD